MKSIGVVTDSHGGISQKEAQRLGVKILPMPFYFNEDCYYEGVSIKRDEFFRRLNAGEKVMGAWPMGKNIGFNYTYSATANKEVQEIRKKYMPKEESAFEELKRLDYQVNKAGQLQGLLIGIVGSLILGLGMCFSLKVIGDSISIGVLLGIVGVVVMLFAYPVFRSISERVKCELTPRILKLAEEIMNEQS